LLFLLLSCLDGAELAEVIDGMTAIASASADTQQKQPTMALAQRRELVR